MFQDFFLMSDIPCCITDDNMKILQVNNKFTKVFGSSIFSIFQLDENIIENIKQPLFMIKYNDLYFECRTTINGEFVYFMFIEVTFQKTLNDALEEAVEGVSRLDDDGNYIYLNHAYADICGYTVDDLIGKSWINTVHPDSRDKMKRAYYKMLKNGKVTDIAYGLKKDGSWFIKRSHMVYTNGVHYCFCADLTKQYTKKQQKSIEFVT